VKVKQSLTTGSKKPPKPAQSSSHALIMSAKKIQKQLGTSENTTILAPTPRQAEGDEKLIKEEMEEIARLWKKSVHKPNPVRRYKPTNILPSDKPPTDPRSPSFMSRKRANS
jgi:hypothetical protein